MLSLNRKTDYALVALAHLAGSGQRRLSVRQIAEAPLLRGVWSQGYKVG